MKDVIISDLKALGLKSESNMQLPIVEYPWKTGRTKAPKCDILVSGIYIQLGGWMTIYNIAKYVWFANQDFPYYFMDVGDDTWEPWIDSPCPIQPEGIGSAGLVRSSIKQQELEIQYFANGKQDQVSELSRKRLNRHIIERFNTFKEWGMEIPKVG